MRLLLLALVATLVLALKRGFELVIENHTRPGRRRWHACW
jgi:hypothetical protein